MPAQLDFIVLYSSDIERCRKFYELLELRFVQEKHGNGPIHYASNVGTTVLELYPANHEVRAQERIGFIVPSIEDILRNFPSATRKGHTLILTDPDGRKVHIRQ